VTARPGEAAPERSATGLRAYGALAALVLGLVLGAFSDRLAPSARDSTLAVAGFVGTLWLNALKMTVIPLVVALLVVGIAKSREAAMAGRIAGRSVAWIVIICTLSAVFGAVMIQLLTKLFPLARDTAASLQRGLAGVEDKAATPLPGIADFFKGVIPDNIFAAATNGDILPLVVASVLFALALAGISQAGRCAVVILFEAIADAFVVIIGWVLWLAPLGVLALAYTVGAAAGGAAFAGLGHYVVLISIIGVLVTAAGYPLACIGGRIGFGAFARALIGPQTVAISTRSSLASLPASAGAVCPPHAKSITQGRRRRRFMHAR